MNCDRIYQYRFQGIDPNKKRATWKILADFIYRKLGCPSSIIDPAAGGCEFINQVPSRERWAVDLNPAARESAASDVKVVIGDNLSVDLPERYFDAVYISNFLEHLRSQREVAAFLGRMYDILKPGGVICVMGPNFRYCYRNYFDFADHSTILSDLSVSEHLCGAGFDILEICPRFLPLSFRGNLPAGDILVKVYLRSPLVWRILGKQFLITGRKNDAAGSLGDVSQAMG